MRWFNKVVLYVGGVFFYVCISRTGKTNSNFSPTHRDYDKLTFVKNISGNDRNAVVIEEIMTVARALTYPDEKIIRASYMLMLENSSV